jgi:hypothetical protein
MGAEVLDLTERYLEVRFAGRPLSEPERKQYVQRIRNLRQGDEPRAAA